MGVQRNHRFAPGVPPGWIEKAWMEGEREGGVREREREGGRGREGGREGNGESDVEEEREK